MRGFLGFATLAGLVGCRVAREGEAEKAKPTPVAHAEPAAPASVAHAEPAAPASVVRAEQAEAVRSVPDSPVRHAVVSPLVADDAGVAPIPFPLVAPEAMAPSGAPESHMALAQTPEPEPPSQAKAPVETALVATGSEVPAQGPVEPELAVIVTGVGIDAQVLSAAAREACRALANDAPLWPTLDAVLSTLSCGLRASGRPPREALVMGSDGSSGATGALPFDLDPARVVARVRDARLGSVVSDAARAIARVQATFRCPQPDAAALKPPKGAGFAGVLLRDAKASFAGGLVGAPERERAEGYLGAAVFPGDYLEVREGRAVLLLGPDGSLRARGRARALAGSELPLEVDRDHPLAKGAQQLVWLDPARAGSLEAEVARFAWRPGTLPNACREEDSP